MKKILIFDLDGTLIDSNAECVAILQEMLDERRIKRRIDPASSAPYMSLGGAKMVTALLGDACIAPDEDLNEFRLRYAQRITPADSLFDGVAIGLKHLKDKGFRLAICSNKPANLCRKVLGDTGLADYFCSIVGTSPGVRPKPAPDLLHLLLAEMGAEPHDCLFIGDSELDEAIAAVEKIPFLLMRYGYGSADWVPGDCVSFECFAELVDHLVTAQERQVPQEPVTHRVSISDV
jgi:phosphoglycolate phosphatase